MVVPLLPVQVRHHAAVREFTQELPKLRRRSMVIVTESVLKDVRRDGNLVQHRTMTSGEPLVEAFFEESVRPCGEQITLLVQVHHEWN